MYLIPMPLANSNTIQKDNCDILESSGNLLDITIPGILIRIEETTTAEADFIPAICVKFIMDGMLVICLRNFNDNHRLNISNE